MSLKYSVWQNSTWKEKARAMAIIRYRQKDKRCAERYTIFQPRKKSLWTLTIIWDKYNVDFMVNYVSGTLLCSRIGNMHPESPQTVFNFKLMLFYWSTNQTCSLNIHIIKNNTEIRACGLSVHQMCVKVPLLQQQQSPFRINPGLTHIKIKRWVINTPSTDADVVGSKNPNCVIVC